MTEYVEMKPTFIHVADEWINVADIVRVRRYRKTEKVTIDFRQGDYLTLVGKEADSFIACFNHPNTTKVIQDQVYQAEWEASLRGTK